MCLACLLNVSLGAKIAGLHYVSCDLHVAVNHERLIWPVCVHADAPSVVDGVRRRATLPAQLHVRLKLPRVRRLEQEGLSNFSFFLYS